MGQDPASASSPGIQAEHRYLEAVFRTMRQPLLVLDGALSVQRANRAFYRLFDVRQADTEGRKIYDLGNGQWNIAELRSLLEDILPTKGEVTDYRVEHEFEEIGRRVMVLNAYRMERDNDVDLILLSIEDVTERDRALWELEGQKEYAEKIVDASRDALLILDWDLRVKTANETFYRDFRVDPSETIGKMVYELGNGQWNIPTLRELLENVLPEDNSFDNFIVQHEFEEIGRRTMVLNGRRVDHMQLILLAIEDQTEMRNANEALRKSEGRFRAMVRATSLSLHSASPDWSFINELDHRGLIKDDPEPTQAWLCDNMERADQPLALETIQKAIRIGRPFELEYRVRRPDGAHGWTLLRAVPIRETGAEIAEWFLAASDITDRRLAQEELARARGIDAIGRLAGGIAHDFNNLLTTILANIELAEIRVGDAPTKNVLDRAAKAALLGASFSRRLLSLAGKRQSLPQEIDINTPVRETSELLERGLGDRIELTLDLTAAPWPVFVDPGEIESVLLNLALNARDAMPKGGSITIRTRNMTVDGEQASTNSDAHQGDYVCLSVTDTGVGMSKELLQRASEAFFSSKEQDTGTGLGLFSVETFARQSNGFMQLESMPGQGTTVRICLPRVADRSEVGAAETPTAETAHRVAEETVLVVEDNPALREVTRERMEALGYTVLEAGSAAAAMKLLRTDSGIRLVFTDLIMSGEMNGLDLARWVKTEKPEVAVLLNSGYSAEIDKLVDTDTTADGPILAKPYTLDQLADAVREALD